MTESIPHPPPGGSAPRPDTAAAEPIRVAVIGIGHLGRHHARILRSLPGVHLTAAVDVVLERAQEAVQGCSATALRDFRKALPQAQACVLAVPTTDHYRIASACLRAGKAVFVEKPITRTPAQGRRLVDLAARLGLPLQVGHVERFHPAVRAAAGHIGPPLFVEVQRVAPFSPRALDVDVVTDLMIHDIDLLLHLVDAPLHKVDAVGIPVLSPRIDMASARLEFASGCVAHVTASRVSRSKARKIRIISPNGYFTIDTLEGKAEWIRPPRPGGIDLPTVEVLPLEEKEPLAAELEDFLHAVRTGTPPPVTGEDGLHALQAARRVLRALARSAQRVRLPLPPSLRAAGDGPS